MKGDSLLGLGAEAHAMQRSIQRDRVAREIKLWGVAYWVARIGGRVRVCRRLTLAGVPLVWRQGAMLIGPMRTKEIAHMAALVNQYGLGPVERAVDEAIARHQNGA